MVQSQLQTDIPICNIIFNPLWCLIKNIIFSQQPVTVERLGIPVLQHILLPFTSDKHPHNSEVPAIHVSPDEQNAATL
jgi:hypothetical protein